VSHRILIVDADEAFATMLQQFLEETGGIQAVAVSSGQEALKVAASDKYDLAIVDLDLRDVEGPALVRALREEHPRLRLIVIPLEGAEVPPDLAEADVQGALPKPFFLPELPDRIAAAMSRPVGGEPAAEAAPAVLPQLSGVIRRMSRLAQEVGAEAVLLTQGSELLAQAGRLPEEEVVALATVVSDSWRTSARVAKILGKEQLRFEQSIKGAEHLLYSLALAEDLILSVVVEGRVPLGMIRHRAKEAAEAIREQIGV